jgi:NMD protein affecting ribosome stability and mRNA decay
MTGTCMRCGRDAEVEGHHPMCRDELLRYLYRLFRVRLCKPCHTGMGDRLRDWGLDKPTVVTAALLVGRLAALFAYLAMAERPITLDDEHVKWIARILSDAYRLIADHNVDDDVDEDGDG